MNTHDIELLPCPFCGGQAEMDTRQGYRALGTGRMGNRIAVYCRSCDADMGVCIEDVPDITPEQVAEMWNRRAAVEADRQGRGEPVVWKPIETAPKDNRRLLYLARLDDQGKLVELDFDGTWEYWQESWELSHINGYCWMSANGIEEPTHWAYQDEPPPTTPQSDEPSDPAKLDLVSRLRALARYEHNDVSVADEAADALSARDES